MALDRARLGLGLAVAALAVGLYLPALDHAWLNYDDDLYVTENPQQLQGLTPEGVAWAFTSFHGANWFPLTRLSWALDLEIFGLSARGFRTTSLLLHAATALLLFLALARLTGRSGASAFVAAVFAAHPLHVESVVWVAARKDTLSGLFFALALLVYARRAGRARDWRSQGALLACLGAGLMAKPSVAPLPAVLLLLDGWPLGRLAPPRRAARLGRALREKAPLLLLVAAFAVLAFAAQRSGGAWVPFERLPLLARLENATFSTAVYLGQVLWPTGLAVFHPHPGDGIPGRHVLGALALIVALSIAALRRPYWTVGWLWFLVMLLPSIGLIQVGSQARADRYMYWPLVGPTLALTWTGLEWAGGRPAARRALALAGIALVAALSLTTLQQLRHWRDSEALFRHALRVTPDNSIARAQLGDALLEAGRVAEGLAQLRRAAELDPGHLEVINNLAWLLATLPDESLRDPPTALRLARIAVADSGDDDPAVLDTLAAAEAAMGRSREAAQTARRALDLAEARGDAALAGEIRRRLSLYRGGRPYRESLASRRRATR